MIKKRIWAWSIRYPVQYTALVWIGSISHAFPPPTIANSRAVSWLSPLNLQIIPISLNNFGYTSHRTRYSQRLTIMKIVTHSMGEHDDQISLCHISGSRARWFRTRGSAVGQYAKPPLTQIALGNYSICWGIILYCPSFRPALTTMGDGEDVVWTGWQEVAPYIYLLFGETHCIFCHFLQVWCRKFA